MERKIVIGIIVLFTVLVMIGIGHDYGEAIFKWFRTESAAKTPTETPEEIEIEKRLDMEKLGKIASLVDSEEFLGGFTVSGIVEEIFGHNLVIGKFNEEGERILVAVPISEDVQVTCDGKKVIDFEDIKPGDKVFVLLNQMLVLLSDCPLEGVYVDVVPERI